ncbi:MAG TPA: nucleotidyl transferase AbiEii/AbiGii toxin family protein [Trebonia sp.]
MPLSQLHRDIAAVALRVAARYGFALAGGNALLAHEFVVRETEDVDLFTNVETGVEAAADDVESALRGSGFATARQDKTAGLADIFEGMGDGLAEWIVTAPDGRQTMLQLSYFDREHEPVRMDVGPVLDLEDLIGQKVCALASRIEVRDYIDTAQALREYTAGELILLARRRDPGLEERDFAEAGQELDRLTDAQFAQYRLTPQDIAEIRAAFADWPR